MTVAAALLRSQSTASARSNAQRRCSSDLVQDRFARTVVLSGITRGTRGKLGCGS
jgi:hypothetical protein